MCNHIGAQDDALLHFRCSLMSEPHPIYDQKSMAILQRAHLVAGHMDIQVPDIVADQMGADLAAQEGQESFGHLPGTYRQHKPVQDQPIYVLSASGIGCKPRR